MSGRQDSPSALPKSKTAYKEVVERGEMFLPERSWHILVFEAPKAGTQKGGLE